MKGTRGQRGDHVEELVYIGSKRTVFALDAESGNEVWRVRLPRLWGSQVTLLVDGDSLLVARGSYIYRLDRWTGEILWEHAILESPTYLLTIATARGQSPGDDAQQQAAVAATTASIMASSTAAASG
jgi:outer membrane protein assembly factor BamB